MNLYHIKLHQQSARLIKKWELTFNLISSLKSNNFLYWGLTMQRNHVHIFLTIPRSNTTIVCHNRNQMRTKIKMSSYSFQDVYNHVCWICHPIKHERHYPHFLPRARWNTLTFRVSRRTEPTQSLQWYTGFGHTDTGQDSVEKLINRRVPLSCFSK